MGVINIETLSVNSQEFLVNSDLKQGLLRGSIWENLFEPYKFSVSSITDGTEKELANLMLKVYTFASIELTLYYTTHMNNLEALELLKKVNIEKAKLEEYYSKKYNALSSKDNDPETYFRSQKHVGI